MTKFYLFTRYLTVLLVFVATAGWSQGRTVTGRVTAAEDGTELPGVNIVEKGTSNGTITSADGSYSISVGENATLVFSFVGYKAKEVPVGAQGTINATLEADVTALSEVVVIGYGEVRKRDATGAVASVKSEDFNRGLISSPEQLIQGKTAGVQITNASGEPGAGVNIRIRGTSSVRGGNNPLFVVDGIPLSGEDISAGGLDIGRGNAATKNPLNFLNPSDIESIDILKDASATAIYGSRGANGVVLITTKSGKGMQKQIEYASSVSFSRMAQRYDLLNREQFLAGLEALGGNVAANDHGSDTDWQDVISRTAVSHRHDLSFSDNHKFGNYRVSLSYDDQEGIIRTSGMERLTGRLNTSNTFFNNKLELGGQLTFSRVNDQAAPITNNSGFEGDLIGSTYMANPTWPNDPTVQPVNTNANPASYLEYHQDNTETDRMLINLSGGYNITNDFSFKVNAGFDRSESIREKAFSSLLNLSNGVAGNGRAGIGEIEASSNLLEAFFNYKKKVGKGELTAVLGYSYQEFNRKGATYLGWGFDSDNMDVMISDMHQSIGMIKNAIGDRSYQQFGYAPANTQNPVFFINQLFPEPVPALAITEVPAVPLGAVSGDRFETVDELQSFFGRVNYSLLDKYLFTGTVRVDGSTRFGGDNKYGTFPSLAVAWRLSEEDFIPDVFDDLKLRVGYGITGNQEIPHNLHQGRQRFGGVQNNAIVPAPPTIGNDGTIAPPGIGNVTFHNPDLKWEQTSQLNVGLDFGFLAGKLSGTLDLYQKVTSDLLIQVSSPAPAPQPFTWRNLDADVVNNGVELTLNYYAIDEENTGLNFGFNISYNDNEVRNYTGAPLNTGNINGQGLSGAFAQRIANNQPLYVYYIREFIGFDEGGIAQYNGDFQRYIGKSPIPKYNLGFSVGFRYMNWDLSAFLAGQFGHYVYNNTRNAYFNKGSLGTAKNVTKDVLSSPEATVNAPDASTLFLESGDFLRMQNLNLGYNFDFTDKFIKKLRLYGSAQNLFLITDYSGLDPEVNVNKERDGVPSLGIDYTSYPRARTFTFGLNATF